MLVPEHRLDEQAIVTSVNLQTITEAVRGEQFSLPAVRKPDFPRWVESALRKIDLRPVSWDKVIAEMGANSDAEAREIAEFYRRCLHAHFRDQQDLLAE